MFVRGWQRCVNSATEWASPATECETVGARVQHRRFLTTLMTDNTAWIITIVVSPIPICKHITTFALHLVQRVMVSYALMLTLFGLTLAKLAWEISWKRSDATC
jgi:hypothetical protein